MNCPKCGKELEMKNKQVGVDENDKPILNEYAICRDCKKQWNLNKQNETKAATSTKETTAPKKAVEPPKTSAAPKKKPVPPEERPVPKKRPATEDQRPTKKKRPTPETEAALPTPTESRQTYGNIPSEKVRAKSERTVRRNYEDMLATDPDKQPPVKKKRPAVADDMSNKRPASTAPKKRPVTPDDAPKKRPAPSDTPKRQAPAASKKPAPQPKQELPLEEDIIPRFPILRIVFGVISLVLFAFFAYKGFMAGLSNISSGKSTLAGTVYIVLALCMLVSGLLLFILRNKDTILTFVFPMIFYIGGAVFAFIKRGDDKFLLICAAIGAVLGVIFLVLTFAARGGHDEDDFDDDYDDPFEDDYDN